MPTIATIEDVHEIARRSTLDLGRSILGVTASVARYDQVPSTGDPDAVFEFLVDVYLLEGLSQTVMNNLVIGGDASGLKKLNNVMVGIGASGDLFANHHVPVLIEKDAHSGQLYISGRAKIALPKLQLDEYSLEDLDLLFTAELELNSDGVYVDGWGVPLSETITRQTFKGLRFSCEVTVTTSITTLGDLTFGTTPLGETSTTTTRACSLDINEVIDVGEVQT